jgi:hypothetical protein
MVSAHRELSHCNVGTAAPACPVERSSRAPTHRQFGVMLPKHRFQGNWRPLRHGMDILD